MALKIFEPRYMDMAKAALKHDSPFGIALIREGVDVGTPAVPERIGTMARIAEWDMQQLGVLQVRVHGEQRFRIQSQTTNPSGLIVAKVEMIEADANDKTSALPVCAAFLRKVIAQIGDKNIVGETQFDDAFWVGIRLTEILPLGNQIKQKMLELTSATMRLEILQRFLVDQGLVIA